MCKDIFFLKKENFFYFYYFYRAKAKRAIAEVLKHLNEAVADMQMLEIEMKSKERIGANDERNDGRDIDRRWEQLSRVSRS